MHFLKNLVNLDWLPHSRKNEETDYWHQLSPYDDKGSFGKCTLFTLNSGQSPVKVLDNAACKLLHRLEHPKQPWYIKCSGQDQNGCLKYFYFPLVCSSSPCQPKAAKSQEEVIRLFRSQDENNRLFQNLQVPLEEGGQLIFRFDISLSSDEIHVNLLIEKIKSMCRCKAEANQLGPPPEEKENSLLQIQNNRLKQIQRQMDGPKSLLDEMNEVHRQVLSDQQEMRKILRAQSLLQQDQACILAHTGIFQTEAMLQ